MEIEELKSYFKNELKWGWSHQSRIVFDFLCDARENSIGGIVLDAGAGNQRYKPFFEKSVYIAQEHPIAGELNKDIKEYDILSDVKRIPLCDDSVDIVLSTSSLEHIEFPDSFFLEAYRILKPGGCLYINVPFAYAEHEIPYDFQRLTRYGLARSYSHSGFENISILPTSSSLYTAEYLLRHNVAEELRREGLSFTAKIPRLLILGSIYLFCRPLFRLIDRGPLSTTILPIGWIAKGFKPGQKYSSSIAESKIEFMNRNALCDENEILLEGRIVPKNKGSK